MDILEKPKKIDEEEISSALGKLLWGEEGGKFSMRRLILNLMKKRLGGRK
ncbi:hypothetical protein ES708_02427 [subsurface metagenome]|jgi:hypothetical protein